MLIKDLGSFAGMLEDYTELRVQASSSKRISMLNGNITSNYETAVSGVSSRFFHKGSWGFASHSEINDDAIKAVIKSAKDNAVFLNKKYPVKGELYDVGACNRHDDFSTKAARKTRQELVDYLKEIDDYIADTFSLLTSRSLSLVGLDIARNVLVSSGTSFYSMIPRSGLSVNFSTEKDGKVIELYKFIGGLGQIEDTIFDKEVLLEKLEELYKKLVTKRDGIYADTGIKDCILDSNLAGILAHEAIGHNTEADFILGGSTASGYFNKQAASPLISIVDFANTAFGETCMYPVFVDDEGTEAEDVTLIDKGILVNYMHNKETAVTLNGKPCGNARAFNYSDEPLVRMRNTAIIPGKSKLDEMIASIKDGYYLVTPSNGQADSTGEFMFGVTYGFSIKDGKLDKPILDTTISGIAYDVLKSVDMVSDEITWHSGMCGKKQSIPVSLGGPAIKCKVKIGGK